MLISCRDDQRESAQRELLTLKELGLVDRKSSSFLQFVKHEESV